MYQKRFFFQYCDLKKSNKTVSFNFYHFFFAVGVFTVCKYNHADLITYRAIVSLRFIALKSEVKPLIIIIIIIRGLFNNRYFIYVLTIFSFGTTCIIILQRENNSQDVSNLIFTILLYCIRTCNLNNIFNLRSMSSGITCPDFAFVRLLEKRK